MKQRNPIAVFAFGLITLGFYSWYWAVKTKGEMNKLGEKIPTAWIWLIPIVGSIWWYWKYSEGVEHVTHKELSGVLAFVVLYLLGNIGQAIVQDYFNKLQPAVAGAMASPTPMQPPTITPLQPPVAPLPPPTNPQPPVITPPNPPVVGG